jgi:bacteriorhodopsin
VVTVLVAGFAILGVACSLLMAVSMLVAALGDALGATVLRWVACGCGILVALDLVLLVVALGLNAIDPRQDENEGQ